MPNDGMMGGPEVDDDGADEMGAVQDQVPFSSFTHTCVVRLDLCAGAHAGGSGIALPECCQLVVNPPHCQRLTVTLLPHLTAPLYTMAPRVVVVTFDCGVWLW